MSYPDFIKILVLLLTAMAVVLVMAVAAWHTSPRRRSQRKTLDTASWQQLEAKIGHLRQCTLLLCTRGGLARGQSYLGGLPPASPGFQWPQHEGRPLAFLACLDCGQLPHIRGLDWLPAMGYLLFFYDAEQSPWGFDPKDSGSCAVRYLPPEAVPDVQQTVPAPAALSPASLFPQRTVGFHPLRQLAPPLDIPQLANLPLSLDEVDTLKTEREELYDNHPRHQVGGAADHIQSPEMDWECELTSHGIFCGDPAGYQGEKAARLHATASAWSLLLQLDSDEELNMNWGDAGRLYFWVRREEARQLNFSNVWAILQSA